MTEKQNDRPVQLTPELEALIDIRVEQKVQQTLKRILGGIFEDDSKPEWVDGKVAYKELGYESVDALYKSISRGLFRLNKEVRDRRTPGSQKPRYQFNLEACHKRLNSDPVKRPVV